MKPPKNGRLRTALKLVDNLADLGYQASGIARQIQELYPDLREISMVSEDLDVHRVKQHARLRELIVSQHHKG